MENPKVVGLIEKIRILGERVIETYALFDTGARGSSIDIVLAAKARLGPITGTMAVRNPSMKAKVRRPVVRVSFEIDGEIFEAKANIQDRSHMNLPVLIGRNVTSGKFVVDPERNRGLMKELEEKQEREEKIYRIIKRKKRATRA